MSKVIVHKAVEPRNLTKAGKARYAELLQDLSTRAVIQPKYDGVYVQFIHDRAGWYGYSRTGEFLHSVPLAVLKALDTYADPTARYIGELWAPGVPHSEINGASRRLHPQVSLQVVLFDCVLPDRPESPYVERHARLSAFHGVGSVRRVERVVAPKDASDKWLYEAAKLWAISHASAYDGLILRDANGLFVEGAGKGGEIIKIKPRYSGDFRVIGTTAGKGKYEGAVGALILDLGGGVTCEVGTGLTDHDRRGGSDPWCGLIAEIEYLAITKDGKLREPSFKSVRWDKMEADILPGNIKQGD